jgi:hypothetical protein
MARPLRVLLIHDTDFQADDRAILGTSALIVSRLHFSDIEYTALQMRSWSIFLELMRSLGRRPDCPTVELDVPDILLIDCHFDDDFSAPPLNSSANQDTAAGKRSIDARGLFYGAVLVAYHLGQFPEKPFGFAIYSQDIGAAAADGYAQTFFSVLDAISGSTEPQLVSPDGVRTRMEQIGSGKTPDVVVPIGLQSYRDSLERSFRDALYPILATFEKAAGWLSKIIHENRSTKDSRLVVEWLTSGSRKESIFLSSLFADCLDDSGQWLPTRVKQRHAIEFLKRILEWGNPIEELLKPALNNLAVTGERKWSAGNRGYKQKTLAFFIAWAKDRSRCNASASRRNKPVRETVTALNSLVGLSNREMNRALGAVLGNADRSRASGEALFPASTAVEILDSGNQWRFVDPVWLKPLIQESLKIVATGKDGDDFKPEYWPKCLADDPSPV